MRFSAAFIALVATTLMPLLASAIQLTNGAYNGITSGQPFTLTWSGDGTPVTILLETGPSNSLTTVSTLASGTTGTSATVTIPSVPSGSNYAFAIQQSGQTNYSPEFTIAGTPGATITNNNNNIGVPGQGITNNNNNGVPAPGVVNNNNNGVTTQVVNGVTEIINNNNNGYSTQVVNGVTQIVDGQVQVLTSVSTGITYVPAVTQISDGQVQAAGSVATPVYSVYSTYSTYATTPTSVYIPPPGYTNTTVAFQGAASKVIAGAGAAAAAAGVAFLAAM